MNQEEIENLLDDYDAEIHLYSKGNQYRLTKTPNREYRFEEISNQETVTSKDINALYQTDFHGIKIKDILETESLYE